MYEYLCYNKLTGDWETAFEWELCLYPNKTWEIVIIDPDDFIPDILDELNEEYGHNIYKVNNNET
jgi:hypothetical protein